MATIVRLSLGETMHKSNKSLGLVRQIGFLSCAFGLLAVAPFAAAQDSTGTENGEWHFLGGDSHHTRYSAVDQINADNFETIEEAWV